MTEYNNTLIAGLQEDKLDASISVRGIEGTDYYIAQETRSNDDDFTITCGFKPKAVYVNTGHSVSYGAEVDGELLTSTIYMDGVNRESLGTGASSSVPIFYDDDTTPKEIYLSEFTSTGVSFNSVSLGGNTYTLQITIYK